MTSITNNPLHIWNITFQFKFQTIKKIIQQNKCYSTTMTKLELVIREIELKKMQFINYGIISHDVT